MWRVSKVGFVCPSICVFLSSNSISMTKEGNIRLCGMTYLEKLHSPIATSNSQHSHLLARMPCHIHHSTFTAFGFSFTDRRVGVICIAHTFEINCPWWKWRAGQRVLRGGERRIGDE